MQQPEHISIPQGPVHIRSLLGRGKSAYSWLGSLGGREVVCKVMHKEDCPYYSFEDEKTRLEERDYHHLRDAGIPVPDLLYIDHENNFLLKEYIPGITADRLIAEGLPPRPILWQLFDMASRCRQRGWNIDYFPTNFVISGERLYYVDYEVNPYDARWSLEQWGLYYWANIAGMRAMIAGGSMALLNTSPDSGMPIREPFEALLRCWREEYR